MKSPTILFLLLIAVVILNGCSAASKLRSALGNKFRYTYALVSPKPAGRISFQDSQIKILFRIDDGAIRFQLRNLTSSPMKILWDDASLGVQGRYYNVRNTRTLYLPDPKDSGGGPLILALGYVIDMAVPADNIFFDGVQWQERDLLPTTDRNSATINARIKKNKGSTVDLVLPISMGAAGVKNYTFRFQVTSVDSLPWERYRKPRRPFPPPQRVLTKSSSTDHIVTAVVITGVLGLSALLLTQKKSPVVE